MIKGKTPEEIRKLFNIVNDFTPEEEAQIRKENVSYITNLHTPDIDDVLSRNGPRTDRGCRYSSCLHDRCLVKELYSYTIYYTYLPVSGGVPRVAKAMLFQEHKPSHVLLFYFTRSKLRVGFSR
jgi:hypothetical protein